jgi:tRNA U54 and U55 pseudouridine synthase Pus10
MKKLLNLLFVISLVIIWSCGGGKSGSSDESTEKSQSETKSMKKSKTEDELISSCEDFLDSYEEWVDLYIEAIRAYKDDPLNKDKMTKYMQAMTEASVWAEDWVKLHTCAVQEKYQKRFEEIADKAEKELEEMGFE